MMTRTTQIRWAVAFALFLRTGNCAGSKGGTRRRHRHSLRRRRGPGPQLQPGSKGNNRLHEQPRQRLAVAVQGNGKIVAVGTTQISGNDWNFAVARYNPDGTPDTSFSFDGKLTTDFRGGNDGAWGVAIQSEGKIVVVGDADNPSPPRALLRRGTIQPRWKSGHQLLRR